MVREIDLVSYLPPFMAEYKEINSALKAENPEFVLVWQAANRVLRNEFIETADEYGLSRFEAVMNIHPSSEDTLESRRARILSRWFSSIPYTERVLIKRLIGLCGENNFTLTRDYPNYHLEIDVSLELFGQIEELERLLDEMLPCNLTTATKNNIPCETTGKVCTAGIVSTVETFIITNDVNETFIISGGSFGAGVTSLETVEIN